MEYIDMAKEIENQGIKHYQALSRQCQVKELGEIFAFFVREEQLHCDIFEAWQKKQLLPEVVQTDIKHKAREVFQRLTADIPRLGVPALGDNDAYQKAFTLEKNSMCVCREMLSKIADIGLKKQLRFIIQQEEFHLRLVKLFMDFQCCPNKWLEKCEAHAI